MIFNYYSLAGTVQAGGKPGEMGLERGRSGIHTRAGSGSKNHKGIRLLVVTAYYSLKNQFLAKQF